MKQANKQPVGASEFQNVGFVDLEKGLAIFFCKGLDSRYFRLCGPHDFCCNYSTPPL